MFTPHYSLSRELLANLVKIKNLVQELNEARFSELVLATFEKNARVVSAHASTSIEGNPLRLTDVKQLLKAAPEHIRDTEKEVLNYNQALEALRQYVPAKVPLDEDLMCAIQSLVIKDLLPVKEQGKIRTHPVVVNDPRQGKIVYIPPNAEDVPLLLQDLFAFVKKSQSLLDPLMVAGIFHKQFVLVHPFMDGNGRTTRLLTKYLLASMGLDTFHLFSFENYYNQNITRYFSTVGEFGDYYELCETVDFTPWLVYFTDGIIDELLRVQALLLQTILPVRLSEVEMKIIQYVKKRGAIREAEYVRITNRARSTRILDFHRLVEKGLLVRQGKGKATYYILPVREN